jgi:hypothetical protein
MVKINKHFLVFLFILVVILITFSVSPVISSVRPKIFSELPDTITSQSSDVILEFYVIDDNPRSYNLYINDTLWKSNIIITSNLLTIVFSNVAAHYLLNLTVFDYSGYSSSIVKKITIVLYLTSTSLISTQISDTKSETITDSAATPSFSIIQIFSLFSILVLIKTMKQKQSKR